VCYSIYLSTDSSQDLSGENSELIHFQKESIAEPFRSMLQNEHQWYVGSQSGCSCTFRHLFSIELGFSEPVDWYEEDGSEIAATLSFIRVIRQLIESGQKVDCIDVWNNAAQKDIVERVVNLKNMDDEQFRFFENHRFIFENVD
jgi:hypothetical protein